MRVLRRMVLPALALAAIAGCGTAAKQLGSNAADGAIESVERWREERPDAERGMVADRTGRAAGAGAVQEITRPETIDRLSDAVERAVERLSTPRVPEGAGGSGPPIAVLAHEVGTGAVRGAFDELNAQFAASCPAADPYTCLGRSVSAGMVQELWPRLQWPLLAAVFIVGVLLSAIVRQMARLAGVTFRRARGR